MSDSINTPKKLTVRERMAHEAALKLAKSIKRHGDDDPRTRRYERSRWLRGVW
jgi:hypothetical protein